MRSFAKAFTVALCSLAAVACTIETRTTGQAPAGDAGVTQTGDTKEPAPRPAKTPSTTKDGGTAAPPPQSAPTTCKDTVACLIGCDEGDTACDDACLSAISGTELSDLQSLSACVEGSGCSDEACVEQVCAAEIAACLN